SVGRGRRGRHDRTLAAGGRRTGRLAVPDADDPGGDSRGRRSGDARGLQLSTGGRDDRRGRGPLRVRDGRTARDAAVGSGRPVDRRRHGPVDRHGPRPPRRRRGDRRLVRGLRDRAGRDGGPAGGLVSARSLVRPLVAAGLAAAAAAGVMRARRPAAARWPRLVRLNHAGRPVSLLEGPAAGAGLLAAAACAPGTAARTAALTAVGTAGLLGAVDDFAGSGTSKGLRGPLSALVG